MISLIAAALIVGGTLLMLVAAVGVARMPDLYIRLQASTKAASLGAGSVLLALALMFGDFAVAMRALLAITFIFLTVPISGHMIARAAYLVGVPPWDQTRWDELKGKYDRVTHVAASPHPGKATPATSGSGTVAAAPLSATPVSVPPSEGSTGDVPAGNATMPPGALGITSEDEEPEPRR